MSHPRPAAGNQTTTAPGPPAGSRVTGAPLEEGAAPGAAGAAASAGRTAPAGTPDRGALPDRERTQRRTLRLLFGTQIVAGIGFTIGVTLGALLAEDLGGTDISGLAASSSVVGGALLAVPVTRLMRARGRRPGLAFAYLVAAAGAVLVVLSATVRSVPLMFLGMALFGGGTTANLQARYAAVDLSGPDRRGRHLSLIVWATTIGSVVAPNLASGMDGIAHGFGLPLFVGPFAFSAIALAGTALAIILLLRPDPLLTARKLAAAPADAAPADAAPADAATRQRSGRAGSPATTGKADTAGGAPADSRAGAGQPDTAGSTGAGRAERDRAGMWQAWLLITRRPSARLGVAAVAVGHLVMVAVMSMTPLRIGEAHHADVLRVVGFVLSVHIAGMYALAPVVGILTDRIGRHGVIYTSIGVLLAACAIAGTAGHDTARLTVGLGLLGLGWSGTMVAGSTLLTESVPEYIRPAAQGLSDMLMGLAGAAGGAVSGVIVGTAGYPTLTLLAALSTVPLLALALRTAAVPRPGV